jgi:hypothetical protein
MPLRALLAAPLLAVVCGQALAADVVGYSEAFDTLFRVDLTTHTAQEIGAAGFVGTQRIADIEGISYSPAGDLFAVSDALKALIRVNAQTGRATVVGTLNLAGESISAPLDLGMTFTCDGRLWLSGGDGNFWQVDPASGATTLVGNLGVKVTGLAANGMQVYGAGSQGNNNFYRIDTATAHATVVGAYNTQTYITTASPAFDGSGKLYQILAYVPPKPGTTVIPPWSDLAEVDGASGNLTNTGNITGPSDLQTEFYGDLKGLAIAPTVCTAGATATDPTPALSPASTTLLILLLGLLAGTRLRRHRPI